MFSLTTFVSTYRPFVLLQRCFLQQVLRHRTLSNLVGHRELLEPLLGWLNMELPDLLREQALEQ